jgi:hypothetical protein
MEDLNVSLLKEFFKDLKDKTVIRPNTRCYLAFKEALAQHLVPKQRLLQILEDSTNREQPERRPTSRSSRKSRLLMFGRTNTVQRIASKYDVAFLGLVFCCELTNRDKKKGEANEMKNKWWDVKDLALYSDLVQGIGTMWHSFVDDDYIYPLSSNRRV